MNRKPPELDLAAELDRPDLRAIGLVFFQAARQRTDTLWCEPDVDPGPLVVRAEAAGQVIGAMLLVCDTEVAVAVHPVARDLPWFTAYVERVAHEIKRRGGLEEFFGGTVAWERPPVIAAGRN